MKKNSLFIGLATIIILLVAFGIWYLNNTSKKDEKYSKPGPPMNYSSEQNAVQNTDQNFCGSSGHESCNSNDDCIASGCSLELCTNKNNNSLLSGHLITNCQWKECYDSKKYQMSCQCINGGCEWTKK